MSRSKLQGMSIVVLLSSTSAFCPSISSTRFLLLRPHGGSPCSIHLQGTRLCVRSRLPPTSIQDPLRERSSSATRSQCGAWRRWWSCSVCRWRRRGPCNTHSAARSCSACRWRRLCKGHGVDFAVAYVDVELWELALGDPDDSVEGKLMPKKKAGVFCVQVTGLKCGGLVLACKFDHHVADAYSANIFLVFWLELATFSHATHLPSLTFTI
ncbi:uncharacterized protein LOC122001799 [Zingiber officinale]|uniref:uncharacterized protein LOC122001799 n=1 Tax=Zingiber officinale TaxID=94328 RepID=UPI001C4B7673|nr:uncharacterized protein LOC122001799 [Zingiber officinale]XP_042412667.1 uncharacterized protein LOC122001799 [Zingiber officinale]